MVGTTPDMRTVMIVMDSVWIDSIIFMLLLLKKGQKPPTDRLLIFSTKLGSNPFTFHPSSFFAFPPLFKSSILLWLQRWISSSLLSAVLCPGYTLLPAGKADNLSDSSHSEISSRSSICSVDSVPAPGLEDRCNSSTRTCTNTAASAATTTTTTPVAVAESTAATHAHSNADYNQPSTR